MRHQTEQNAGRVVIEIPIGFEIDAGARMRPEAIQSIGAIGKKTGVSSRTVASIRRRKEIQEAVLAQLAESALATRPLARKLGMNEQQVYRALLDLESTKRVTSINERRGAGRIWSLPSLSKKPAIPPRDPLLWALFRAPDFAHDEITSRS